MGRSYAPCWENRSARARTIPSGCSAAAAPCSSSLTIRNRIAVSSMPPAAGPSSSFAHLPRVMSHVVGDEGLDEVITVVISLVPPQHDRLVGLAAGVFEQVWMELFGEVRIVEPLVDQDGGRQRVALHQLAGVIGAPLVAILAEIAAEGLAAPRRPAWRRDRRKRRHRFILPRVAQRRDQRAMPTHRVAENALALRVDWEILRPPPRQLGGNIVVTA